MLGNISVQLLGSDEGREVATVPSLLKLQEGASKKEKRLEEDEKQPM